MPGARLSKRNSRLADEAWNRHYPLFAEMSVRLSKIVEAGHNQSSKLWGGEFLTEVYRIVQKLVKERDPKLVHRDFQLMLEAEGGNPESRNLFNLVIHALEDEKGLEISKGRRSEYANALTYAWKHSVPAPLVHGFILQVCGVRSAAKKNLTDDREPWATVDIPWANLPTID